MDEDEAEAFEEVVRFFYFGNLRCDDTTSVSFLLKLLHVADRLLAAQCCGVVRHTIKAQSNGAPRAVSREDVLNFFGFATSESKKCLESFFTDAMVVELGALKTMFDTYPLEDDRKAFFLALPLCAVISLLALESLNITCENVVLLLAVLWVSSSGQNSTVDDLNELRESIFMASLDVSIINEVISRVYWLRISDIEKERLVASSFVLSRFPSTSINFGNDCVDNAEAIENDTPVSWFNTRQYFIPCKFNLTIGDT